MDTGRINTMIYQSKCHHCKRETPHRVFNLSIRRGLKLQCLSCGKVQGKYSKVNKLEEYHIEMENLNKSQEVKK